MIINAINWADSCLERIQIEFDCATLFIFNEYLQKDLTVKFTGFIGLTNLLMWDDQIIDRIVVHEIQNYETTPFIQMLFSTYNKHTNYGERWLNNKIFEVQVHLINNTAFSIYCQSIDVLYD